MVVFLNFINFAERRRTLFVDYRLCLVREFLVNCGVNFYCKQSDFLNERNFENYGGAGIFFGCCIFLSSP